MRDYAAAEPITIENPNAIIQAAVCVDKDENPYRQQPGRRESTEIPSAQQGGADQPATAPESAPEGHEKPKPDSEGRPQ